MVKFHFHGGTVDTEDFPVQMEMQRYFTIKLKTGTLRFLCNESQVSHCVSKREATSCPSRFLLFFKLINSKCPIEIENSLLCLEEKGCSKRNVWFYGAVAILRRFSGMVPWRTDYSPCMASHRTCYRLLFPTVVSQTV